jgi:hypothetical protein
LVKNELYDEWTPLRFVPQDEFGSYAIPVLRDNVPYGMPRLMFDEGYYRVTKKDEKGFVHERCAGGFPSSGTGRIFDLYFRYIHKCESRGHAIVDAMKANDRKKREWADREWPTQEVETFFSMMAISGEVTKSANTIKPNMA